MTFLMPALSQSLLRMSPRHLCSVKGFWKKNRQYCMRIMFTSDMKIQVIRWAASKSTKRDGWYSWMANVSHLWQVMEIWELEKGKYCSHLQKDHCVSFRKLQTSEINFFFLGKIKEEVLLKHNSGHMKDKVLGRSQYLPSVNHSWETSLPALIKQMILLMRLD